jgi:2-iminobutanoate/2-iminopropanoate deaminase
MPRDIVTSDTIATPAGPFSAAVRGQGTLYLSGQVGQDPATGGLVDGGVAEQARQVFRNVEAILQAAGKTLDDVLRVGLYLATMEDFAAVNAVYAETFAAPYPARTCIAVLALPLGARVEADVVVA